MLCRSAPCSTRRSGRAHQYALSRRSFSRRRIPSLLACKTRPAVRYRTLNSWHCACRPARLPDRRDAGIKKQGILLPAVYRPVKLFDLFRHQQRNIPRPATVQPECLGSLPQQLRQLSRLQPGAVRNFAEFFVGFAPSLSNPDLYQIRLSTTIGSARHLAAARLPPRIVTQSPQKATPDFGKCDLPVRSVKILQFDDSAFFKGGFEADVTVIDIPSGTGGTVINYRYFHDLLSVFVEFSVNPVDLAIF